jgi:arylsulfatase A-like enzyme
MPLRNSERFSAALRGALSGLIFGVFEYAFAILEPMIRWGPRNIGPEHWYWETIFLLFYVVAGGLTGFALNAFAGRSPESIPQAAVGLGLAVMTGSRLQSADFAPAALVVDLALALVAAFSLYALWNRDPTGRFAWLRSPWITLTAAFLFVKAGDWSGGAIFLSAAIMVLAALIALAAALLSRSRTLHRLLDGRFIPATLAACALLLAAFTGLTLRLNSSPPIPAPVSAAQTSLPNVLLLVLDTVRADHLSLYGYPRRTTPHLEELARESVVYRNAISAADMTLSSYGSIYTSLYPSWHRALPNPSNVTGLDSSYTTLAEILSSQGYQSLAVLANSGYLNRDFGMQQGFAFYDAAPVVGYLGSEHDHWLRRSLRPVLDLLFDTAELDRGYRRSDQINSGVLRLLQSRTARSSPFFLSVNYMGAHDICAPPQPYRDLFPGYHPGFHGGGDRQTREAVISGRKSPDIDRRLQHAISQYDGGIAFMDAQVQVLVEYLKRAGLYDRTLIIVTSDHGEALGERGDYGHPSSVHPELVRVPLLVKYPRSFPVRPGTHVDYTVSGLDLLPTILSAANIQPPPGIQGHGLLEAGSNPARTVLSESLVAIRNSPRHRRGVQRALYLGPWKLITTAGSKPELYNWTVDPQESHNLYDPGDPAAKALDANLQQQLQSVPSSKGVTRKMSPSTADSLRGLGYIR